MTSSKDSLLSFVQKYGVYLIYLGLTLVITAALSKYELMR